MKNTRVTRAVNAMFNQRFDQEGKPVPAHKDSRMWILVTLLLLLGALRFNAGGVLSDMTYQPPTYSFGERTNISLNDAYPVADELVPGLNETETWGYLSWAARERGGLLSQATAVDYKAYLEEQRWAGTWTWSDPAAQQLKEVVYVEALECGRQYLAEVAGERQFTDDTVRGYLLWVREKRQGEISPMTAEEFVSIHGGSGSREASRLPLALPNHVYPVDEVAALMRSAEVKSVIIVEVIGESCYVSSRRYQMQTPDALNLRDNTVSKAQQGAICETNPAEDLDCVWDAGNNLCCWQDN